MSPSTRTLLCYLLCTPDPICMQFRVGNSILWPAAQHVRGGIWVKLAGSSGLAWRPCGGRRGGGQRGGRQGRRRQGGARCGGSWRRRGRRSAQNRPGRGAADVCGGAAATAFGAAALCGVRVGAAAGFGGGAAATAHGGSAAGGEADVGGGCASAGAAAADAAEAGRGVCGAEHGGGAARGPARGGGGPAAAHGDGAASGAQGVGGGCAAAARGGGAAGAATNVGGGCAAAAGPPFSCKPVSRTLSRRTSTQSDWPCAGGRRRARGPPPLYMPARCPRPETGLGSARMFLAALTSPSRPIPRRDRVEQVPHAAAAGVGCVGGDPPRRATGKAHGDGEGGARAGARLGSPAAACVASSARRRGGRGPRHARPVCPCGRRTEIRRGAAGRTGDWTANTGCQGGILIDNNYFVCDGGGEARTVAGARPRGANPPGGRRGAAATDSVSAGVAAAPGTVGAGGGASGAGAAEGGDTGDAVSGGRRRGWRRSLPLLKGSGRPPRPPPSPPLARPRRPQTNATIVPPPPPLGATTQCLRPHPSLRTTVATPLPFASLTEKAGAVPGQGHLPAAPNSTGVDRPRLHLRVVLPRMHHTPPDSPRTAPPPAVAPPLHQHSAAGPFLAVHPPQPRAARCRQSTRPAAAAATTSLALTHARPPARRPVSAVRAPNATRGGALPRRPPPVGCRPPAAMPEEAVQLPEIVRASLTARILRLTVRRTQPELNRQECLAPR